MKSLQANYLNAEKVKAHKLMKSHRKAESVGDNRHPYVSHGFSGWWLLCGGIFCYGKGLKMIVKHIPKVKPDYDPYEEDVCGTHLGEVIEIECPGGITIRVRQLDSGIGPSFEVMTTHAQMPEPRHKLFCYISDDDGSFCSGVKSL